MNCPNNYADLIMTEDLFSFNLIKDNNITYPITEFSVYLPDRFDFYIPQVLVYKGYSLRMTLCNQTLTQQDIPTTPLIGNLIFVRLVRLLCVYLLSSLL